MLLVSLISPAPLVANVEDASNPIFKDTDHTWVNSDVDLGRLDYTVYNSAGSFDGFNLIVLHEYNRVVAHYDCLLLIVDMNGTVVNSKQLGEINSAYCPAEFIDPTTILVGTSQGAALWHLENDSMDYLGFAGHHEYEYNPNNKTIFTFHQDIRNIAGIDYIFDTLMEYDLNGTLVWSWNVSDFISADWWCPYHDTVSGMRDLTHSNTIYYVADEDVIYYNSRNTNTFFKLNHTSKEVIWGLGEYGDFALYDLQGNPRNELFYHAHAVEPVGDNTFILFDNDYHNQTDSNNEISRIVEITIDEEAMTANESWYYEAPSRFYSFGFGDADRLPNGNRVGTWGYSSVPAAGTSASLIEVNPNHEMVWKMEVQSTPDYLYRIYRMDRFQYTPGISSLDDIVSTNTTYSLSWDVWYNYRNKQDIPGNYTLYIDGVPNQFGLFTYLKYWRPTSISIDTGLLSLGLHNITMEIDDGSGNKGSDTVMINVETYHISRTGQTFVEKGQTESLPTWSGFTSETMFYNITLNGSLYEAQNWTGQAIVLDPASIDLGTHAVHFQLFNQSELIFDDSFELQVYPSAPPVIIPLQALNQELYWDDSIELSWNISDTTPQSWSILVDGAEVNSDLWSDPTYTLRWNVPFYSEGSYNITIIAFDFAGHMAKSETTLTIHPSEYPYILSSPDDQIIAWGVPNILFEWETYNAETWTLLRNGTRIETGIVTSGVIDYAITDWYADGWLAGIYNLTMVVFKTDRSISRSFWLDIRVDPGDPYADFVIVYRSESYLYGNNSLGAPDGKVSVIYVDYLDGYLTLDMGENEEVIDGVGVDLTVYATGGEYGVSVANSINDFFQYIGSGSGNQSFDLSTSGVAEARYVRITYSIGLDVNLDAIEAIHYNVPPRDSSPPALVMNGDSFRIENGTSLEITWIAFDDTPWSYEIFVNSDIVVSDLWDGLNITYLFEPPNVGVWNVTIVVYDAFGNFAYDTIMVEVYESPDTWIFLIPLALGISVLTVALIIAVKLKKQSG